MKKTVSVALALVFLLGIAVSGALANGYDYPDTTLVQPWVGNNPSGGAFTDVVGDAAVFDTFGANLNGNTLTLFTNWSPTRDGTINAAVKTADLFIDIGCNGTYEYAIRLDTTGMGTYLINPTYQTSQDIFSGLSGLIYGGRYDVNDNAHKVPVWGSSFAAGLTNVLWDEVSPGTYKVDIGIGFLPSNSQWGFIWGTATCANDAFADCVPIPPSVLLMGSGLLGVGLLGWRRRGSEDEIV
jgi:hypothetical protein